jgi:hypothetical protein
VGCCKAPTIQVWLETVLLMRCKECSNPQHPAAAAAFSCALAARALYECRSMPSPQLSNELFVEWAAKLAKQGPMTR